MSFKLIARSLLALFAWRYLDVSCFDAFRNRFCRAISQAGDRPIRNCIYRPARFALQTFIQPDLDHALARNPAPNGMRVELPQKIQRQINVDPFGFQARPFDVIGIDLDQIKDVFALIESAIKLLCGFWSFQSH